MPSPVSPQEILDNAPSEPRYIRVDACVIAYFGDFLHAFHQGLRKGVTEAPRSFGRTIPSNTASAHSRS
jgi:hypothetical protein